LPQPSPAGPQEIPAAAQLPGTHVPASVTPHWLATPPPPHVVPVGHGQLIVPPQPSPWTPHLPVQLVVGVHVPPSGSPHTPAWPEPPQVSGATHVPQLSGLPQPSPVAPHWRPCSAQVFGVQLDVGGKTHDARSKIMYSSTRSCALIAFVSHSAGNVLPPEFAFVT
jgi:hypothetical protein